MDSQRLILFAVFFMSVYFLMDAWNREQQPPPPVPSASTPAPTAAEPPGVPPIIAAPSQPATVAATPPPAVGALPKGETIRVETDLFIADLETLGGDLRRLELLAHRDTLDQKKNFVLLQQGPEHTYVAQSGLIGNGMPDHRTRYVASVHEAKFAPDANTLTVRLAAPAVNGVRATKIYTFHRGSYVIDVNYEIENKGAGPVTVDAYFQLVRDSNPPAGDSAMLPTYTGAAVYTDKEKFQKVAFSDIDKNKVPYPKKTNDGWVAMVQHYFLSAWLPPENASREFYTQRLDNGLYRAGVIVPLGRMESGTTQTAAVALYAGPQDQERLEKLAPGLDLTIDFGWLTVIAKPLFWVLKWLYGWVGNWGTAIILLTVIIKALFYPLSAASYRSMARMGMVAPRLQKLKEQYGEDRQRMNQAMLELYKTEKINPLGGCLPIVVQIPVFIALYWVLLAAVELRHAPFALWIDDLSVPDAYFVLPVLMGATMILQTYLNPEPPDPVQAKIMKIMPIAFSVFFFFFPAGLVLYWLINNILSIAQQWQIKRAIGRATPAHGKK